MELKSYEIKESAINMDERTFKGYASTFDLDQVDDIIHPGAFRKSIQEAFPAKKIKVLWQHWEPLGMPVEMYEDAKGLYVKAKVSKTTLGDEALELMRDGVVDKMSIGFKIPKGKCDYSDDGVRNIREVQLLEFSPVTFPANEAAVITGVKNLEFALNKGMFPRETIEKMISDLTALIKKMEPDITPEVEQPQNVDELKGLFDELTTFARHRIY